MPSGSPVTSIPTSPPSITGLVATVSASTSTTAALDSEDVANYEQNVAEYYGVDVDAVTTEVVYSASGSLTVSVPEDVSEEELVQSVTETIAESLGVHPQNVEVEVDLETGEVSFTVVSNDFDVIQQAQFNLQNEGVQGDIISSIVEDIPSAVVENLVVAEETTATIEFTVDANSASNDVTQAAWQTEQLLSADFEVVIESKCILNVHCLNI